MFSATFLESFYASFKRHQIHDNKHYCGTEEIYELYSRIRLFMQIAINIRQLTWKYLKMKWTYPKYLSKFQHPNRMHIELLLVLKQFCASDVSDVIIIAIASQITGVSIVCSTICSGADQRKHQSSASLAFVMGIHRWEVSPHKGQ